MRILSTLAVAALALAPLAVRAQIADDARVAVQDVDIAATPDTIAATGQSPEQTDSLSRAAATVMAQAIKGSLDNIQSLGVTIDRQIFIQALSQALNDAPTGFTPQEANQYIDAYIQSLHVTVPDTMSQASQQEFVSRMAATPGAVTTPSGLVFIVLQEGEGPMPVGEQTVSLRYTGALSDGTVFDRTESESVQFNIAQVIPGFSEGLRMMRPGGTYRLVIPPALAYGPDGIPGIIPGGSALDFTVTLLEILK